MRAKTINEIDDSIFKPKQLEGSIKIVTDAKEQLESIGIKTSKIETMQKKVGYLSFDILPEKFVSKRIYVAYLEKENYNNAFQKSIEHDTWIYVNFNISEKGFKTITWNDMFLHILNDLHPNIDKQIENETSELNSLEKRFNKQKNYVESLKKIDKILNG